ncbi:MAG: GntR family transcriptional regulator [Solirubrobacteraceae bacterium]
MTHPDVLIPERLTDKVEVPVLAGIGTSVAQHAYVAIRQAILALDAYDANAVLRLDEKRLAADLGVSRTPVREALARLEQEGMVEIIPRRGVRVVRKSKAEIVEMITAWAALESMAARLACERADEDQIGSLHTLFSGFEGGQLRSHLDEYSAANLRFHQRIIELGHSQLIADMADGLLVHVRAIRRHTIGEGDRAERSIVDHMQIIDALRTRDAELAERLVREHALNLGRHVERSWMSE